MLYMNISEAGFQYLRKFFDIISRVVFFPERTVRFANRSTFADKRDPADSCIKPDLFADDIHGEVAFAGDDFQAGFLNGIGEKKFSF